MKPSHQKTVAATPLRRVPVLSETQVRNLVGVGPNGLLFKPGTFVRPVGKPATGADDFAAAASPPQDPARTPALTHLAGASPRSSSSENPRSKGLPPSRLPLGSTNLPRQVPSVSRMRFAEGDRAALNRASTR